METQIQSGFQLNLRCDEGYTLVGGSEISKCVDGSFIPSDISETRCGKCILYYKPLVIVMLCGNEYHEFAGGDGEASVAYFYGINLIGFR